MANTTGMIYQNGNNIQAGVVNLVVDDVADVASLDTSYYPGSTCLVTKTFDVYILGIDHVWHIPE